MNKLQLIQNYGQQIWLDFLSREIILSKKLSNLISKGACGVTTNPSIFAKAIRYDENYLNTILDCQKEQIIGKDLYEKLAINDVKKACQLFSEIYQQSRAEKGYVSIEIDPNFAFDEEKSILEAKRLWEIINYPNLMIKVPATKEGINIIPQLMELGFNINMTLIFNTTQIKEIHEKYLLGIKSIENKDLNGDNLKLVLSFFVSRIDTAIDDLLPKELQGKIAIAFANIIYKLHENFCKNLNHHNLLPSLLWASTSTKNKLYSDVLYVERLIGYNTINTINESTLNAFLDHGKIIENAMINNYAENQSYVNQLKKYNIDLEKVGDKLLEEGLNQFKEEFNQILNYLS